MTMFGTQLPYSLGPESNSNFYSPDAVAARDMRLRKKTDDVFAALKDATARLRDKVKEQKEQALRLLMPDQQPDDTSQQKAQSAVRVLNKVTGIIGEIDTKYQEYATLREEYKKIEILNNIKREASGGLVILQNAYPDSMALDKLKQARRAQDSDSDSDDEEDPRPSKRAAADYSALVDGVENMQM
jgi:hypothetical protein